MPRRKQVAEADAAPVETLAFNIPQVAKMSGLSTATVSRGVADGSIASTKFRGRRIITMETIRKLIAPK